MEVSEFPKLPQQLIAEVESGIAQAIVFRLDGLREDCLTVSSPPSQLVYNALGPSKPDGATRRLMDVSRFAALGWRGDRSL